MIRPVTIDKNFVANLRPQLEQMAVEHKLLYLLAHAYDGVIWGRFDKGKLTLSGEVFDVEEVSVKLRQETLQQARLFGPAGELLIWRTGDGFAAHLINEEGVQPEDILEDETHWLWGTGMTINDMPNDLKFTLMHEGQEGLRHAPPRGEAKNWRVGLQVRHQVQYDEQGQAYIALSRLVDLVDRVEEVQNGTEA